MAQEVLRTTVSNFCNQQRQFFFLCVVPNGGLALSIEGLQCTAYFRRDPRRSCLWVRQQLAYVSPHLWRPILQHLLLCHKDRQSLFPTTCRLHRLQRKQHGQRGMVRCGRREDLERSVPHPRHRFKGAAAPDGNFLHLLFRAVWRGSQIAFVDRLGKRELISTLAPTLVIPCLSLNFPLHKQLPMLRDALGDVVAQSLVRSQLRVMLIVWGKGQPPPETLIPPLLGL